MNPFASFPWYRSNGGWLRFTACTRQNSPANLQDSRFQSEGRCRFDTVVQTLLPDWSMLQLYIRYTGMKPLETSLNMYWYALYHAFSSIKIRTDNLTVCSSFCSRAALDLSFRRWMKPCFVQSTRKVSWRARLQHIWLLLCFRPKAQKHYTTHIIHSHRATLRAWGPGQYLLPDQDHHDRTVSSQATGKSLVWYIQRGVDIPQ